MQSKPGCIGDCFKHSFRHKSLQQWLRKKLSIPRFPKFPRLNASSFAQWICGSVRTEQFTPCKSVTCMLPPEYCHVKCENVSARSAPGELKPLLLVYFSYFPSMKSSMVACLATSHLGRCTTHESTNCKGASGTRRENSTAKIFA